MSAFIDASAIVAIVAREPDAERQAARVNSVEGPIYVSSIAVYEATFGVANKKKAPGARSSARSLAKARQAVAAFISEIGAVEIPLAGEITDLTLEASVRYGKVVGHPARLNMGDCFAYACAKSKGVPLLYKGEDFALTDIASA